ncbi:hypothetical protein GWI33_009187 [Rhynchophorus ferrugineus]|uniref:Uncharacterized protein n=1 Tax=Rhynchophorus ferrugineus TaxID=354439 RepID=A0A834IGW0_RHYFE|nr:hypothetical protein GWI33_009187 [Rhynchophorus ferrugineus]
MNKKEFRVLIKYCCLKGNNIVEAKNWLEFADTAPGNSIIKDCSFLLDPFVFLNKSNERSLFLLVSSFLVIPNLLSLSAFCDTTLSNPERKQHHLRILYH